MRRLLFFIAGFYLAGAQAAGWPDQNPMAGKIDVISYSINITISEPDSSISGSTEIKFKTLEKTGIIKLNLLNMVLDSCQFNHQKIAAEYKNGLILIKSPDVLLPGSQHVISITYHGRPSDGLFIGKNKYGDFCVFSDNWPDRAKHWLPCVDYPSDKASVSFSITTPGKYSAIANGMLKGTENNQDGNTTWLFDCPVPVPTYCIAIGVTNFSITHARTGNGIPLSYYTYPADSLQAVHGFSRAPDMVAFYDSLIGPYPFSGLALVESSTIFGGMENSSAIFFPELSPSYTGVSNNEETVAHEIAHQWFGDDVTEKSFTDLWLSEGFATYFSILYFEFREGKNAKEDLLKKTKERYLRRSSGRFPVISKKYHDPMELLTTENYEKGALFLDALRNEVGDESWFKGIRAYYDKYKHQNVTTSDFRDIMESVSGKDLKSLFQKWLNKPGLPE
jgi:aminopeptidase N